MYNIYCDAEKIKMEYKTNLQMTEEYKRAQGLTKNKLSESQLLNFNQDKEHVPEFL